tara:strand:- start:3641 stop:4705 length:1065 start_codon:yes stop_codon:yes gene_type:complete
MKKKIIIIHDFFNIRGGGEGLVLALSNKIKVIVYSAFKTNFFDKEDYIIAPTLKFKSIFFKRAFSVLFYLFFFNPKYSDTAIFSGSYSILSISRVKSKKKIIYVHSLPKFFFFRNYDLNKNIFDISLSKLFHSLFRNIFIKSYKRADTLIFNSEFTKLKFFEEFPEMTKIKNDILYPFFDSKHFNVTNKVEKNYFLFNSRHESSKRFVEVINFFKRNTNLNLIVTNSGSLTKEVVFDCSNFKNIVFKSNLSFKQYLDVLKSSKGVIMIPKNEDFGMSAIEALACNIPVISLNEGGLKEIFPDNYDFFINLDNFYNSLMDKIILIQKNNFENLYFAKISRKFEMSTFVKKLFIHV